MIVSNRFSSVRHYFYVNKMSTDVPSANTLVKGYVPSNVPKYPIEQTYLTEDVVALTNHGWQFKVPEIWSNSRSHRKAFAFREIKWIPQYSHVETYLSVVSTKKQYNEMFKEAGQRTTGSYGDYVAWYRSFYVPYLQTTLSVRVMSKEQNFTTKDQITYEIYDENTKAVFDPQEEEKFEMGGAGQCKIMYTDYFNQVHVIILNNGSSMYEGVPKDYIQYQLYRETDPTEEVKETRQIILDFSPHDTIYVIAKLLINAIESFGGKLYAEYDVKGRDLVLTMSLNNNCKFTFHDKKEDPFSPTKLCYVLNQPYGNICSTLQTNSTEASVKISNVWDRQTLNFHCSMIPFDNYQYLGALNQQWTKPILYQDPHGSQVFYIWTTSDMKNVNLPLHEKFIIRLVFYLDSLDV